MPCFTRWCLAPALAALLACGGGKSPSEPPPITRPQPVTANAITITQVVPEPGSNLPIDAGVVISFHYETLVRADVGCWLTRDGTRVGGYSFRQVEAGTRGNESSTARVDLNGVTRTDGITCAFQEPNFPFGVVYSTSMPAVYTWFVQ